MVVAADHMGHAHVVVVHDDGKHVDGRSVRAQQDHVVHLVIGDRDIPLHGIGNRGRAVARGADADGKGCVGMGALWHVAPGRAEEGRAAGGAGLFAEGLDFGLGGKALVGAARGEHRAGDLGMAGGAVELAERFAIPVEPEPGEPVKDRLAVFGGGAGAVCILDPQEEPPAAAARKKPVEERGARAADMQRAGRRGGKAGDDLSGSGHRD